MIGTLLSNRYRVDAKLGEGGMGVVYKAHDTLLDRPVAVKTLSPHLLSDEGLKRLLREAQAAAKLTHPNIVGIYDVVEDAGTRFIIMEYVDGRTLRPLLPLPWQRVVDVALDICGALTVAHDHGIVHRDIKPENVIVTPTGTAKVMDFGLARSEGRTRLTQSGMIVGTVAYMAPEQALRGHADARSDLYSLGCVLYEALTGKPPFTSDDPLSVISQHIAAPPVAPRWTSPDIPPSLDAVVMKLLSKDPIDRYPSAEALARGLEDIRSSPDTVPVSAISILETLRRTRFVGREREMAELKAAVDRAVSGDSGVIFIVGEPGIGKTRLCQELAVYAHLRGCRMWGGQSHERETAVPYGPFIEVFRTAQRELANEAWQAVTAQAPQLLKLFPEHAGAAAATVPLPPEQEKVRLFEQVATLIAAWTRRFPLVLLLDDLHWADTATLELFHHLGRALRGNRVLLLGTYRDVEVNLQHPLAKTLEDMNRERISQRILLRRLDEPAVAAMVAASFSDEIAQAALTPIYQETEGNPFFVEEVLRDLAEAGAIYREDGRWAYRAQAALRVPESVRVAIGRRLARLSEGCQRTLTIASVIGRQFGLEVLMAAAGLDEDTLLGHLDETLQAQVVQEARERVLQDVYTFQHALVRETLYEGLNPRRRARFHRSVGEAYERVYSARLAAVIDDLAYHFGRAEQSQAEKAIQYNTRAAEHAASLYAYEDAEVRLRVALELAESLGRTDLVIGLLERLGDLALRLRDGEKAVKAFAQVLKLTSASPAFPRDQQTRLQLKLLEACARWGGAHPDAHTLASELATSAEAAGDVRTQTLALVHLALLHMRARRFDDALSVMLRALPPAETLNDAAILSYAYEAMLAVRWSRGEWDAGHSAAQQRLELAARLDDLAEQFGIISDAGEAGMISGLYTDAERHFEHAMELARKMQSPRALSLALYNLSWVYHGTGRWRESLEFGRQGLAANKRLGEGGVNFIYLCMWVGLSAAYLGDAETAKQMITECELVEYNGIHGKHNFVQARLMLALDDLEGAARHVAGMPAEWPPCAQCQDLYRLVYAEFHARTGEPEKSEQAAREVLRPEAGYRAWLLGEANYCLGLAALARKDADAAINALTNARDILTKVRHVWTLAVTWRELGRAYLLKGSEGDADRAREAFVQAREVFYRHGAVLHGAQVDALMISALGV